MIKYRLICKDCNIKFYVKNEDYTEGEEQWTEERLRGPKVKDLGDEE